MRLKLLQGLAIVSLTIAPLSHADCPEAFRKIQDPGLLKKAIGVSISAHVGAGYVLSQTDLTKRSGDDSKPASIYSGLGFKAPSRETANSRDPRSEAQLIQQAQDALKEWGKTGRLGLDLGEFLIHSEFRQTQPDTLILDDTLKAYARAKTKVVEKIPAQGPVNDPEALFPALKYLNESVMIGYCRDKAMLSEFFTEFCGNCEAHSKLMLSALGQGRAKLPPRYRLGVQNFSDHLEPVIYDQEKDRVLPLSGNRWDAAIAAPVYDPVFFLASYLDSKQVGIPEELRNKILIRAGEKQVVEHSGPHTGEMRESNTPLDFSKFAQGGPKAPPGTEVPKFTTRSFGASGAAGASNESSGRISEEGLVRAPDGWMLDGKPLYIMLMSDWEIAKSAYPTFDLSKRTSPLGVKYWKLGVDKEELRDALTRTQDPQEVRRILMTARMKTLQETFNSKSAQDLRRFIANPELIRDFSMEQVTQMAQTHAKLNAWTESGFTSAGYEAKLALLPQEFEDSFKARLVEQRKAVVNYGDRMYGQTPEIVRRLELLSPEERTKFLLLNQSKNFPLLRNPLKGVLEMAENEDLVVRDTTKRPAEAPPLQVTLRAPVIALPAASKPEAEKGKFSVPEIKESRTGLPSTHGTDENGTGTRPGDPGTKDPAAKKATMEIGLEVMAELLLSDGEPYGVEKHAIWDRPETYRAIERMDPQGRWDENFANLFESPGFNQKSKKANPWWLHEVYEGGAMAPRSSQNRPESEAALKFAKKVYERLGKKDGRRLVLTPKAAPKPGVGPAKDTKAHHGAVGIAPPL